MSIRGHVLAILLVAIASLVGTALYGVVFAAIGAIVTTGVALTMARRIERPLARLTEQHSAELRALSQRLVDLQEAERRHIARELHDEIGQYLTGLGLLLESRNQKEGSPESTAEAKRLLAELIQRVRDLSLHLRPSLLDDFGLLAALIWHCETYTRRTGIQVGVEHSQFEDQRFAPAIETAAYRIAQEALTNVARHAKTTVATVKLLSTRDQLVLEIEDRGVGFDVASARGGTASGLSGMRERAALIGGELRIESRPGGGTRVTVILPGGER